MSPDPLVQLLHLALRAIDDPDALAPMGDLVQEIPFTDPRAFNLKSYGNPHGVPHEPSDPAHALLSYASAPDHALACAIAATLLFDDWPTAPFRTVNEHIILRAFSRSFARGPHPKGPRTRDAQGYQRLLGRLLTINLHLPTDEDSITARHVREEIEVISGELLEARAREGIPDPEPTDEDIALA